MLLRGNAQRSRRVATDPSTRMLEREDSKVQYRIQYLDGLANIIRELSADARSDMSALELVADMPWVPRAVTMRVLDADGREVHSAIKVRG